LRAGPQGDALMSATIAATPPPPSGFGARAVLASGALSLLEREAFAFIVALLAVGVRVRLGEQC
jgi:hypothetical protein